MVPYITPRGHSFKGAGMYYLHDKGATTTERVAWTHTVNLPTDDPKKALNWMAYTASNSNQLKKEAGIKYTGRKSKAGVVYAYSLAWAPDQSPNQQDMLKSALESLIHLKLQDHEAVIVSHNETAHPHVHIICNLVNPKDGRIKAPSYDRLKLSSWAEEKEKEAGKIYCEERVINNQKRREKGQDFSLENVKHRPEKLDIEERIQQLYSTSDNGNAFQAALKEQGYTLAKGDRRGFTLVDDNGKIYSLSRQLKGQRAEDIKNRLADIDLKVLPEAKNVSNEKKHSIEQKNYENDLHKKSSEIQTTDPENVIAKNSKQPAYDTDAFLRDLDAKREFERQMQEKRERLEKQLSSFYNRNHLLTTLEEIQKELKKNNSTWFKITGQYQKLEDQVKALKQNLSNMDNRIGEQKQALENEINDLKLKNFPSKEIKDLEGNDLNLNADNTPKTTQENLIEKRRIIKERFLRDQETNKNKDLGKDFNNNI